MSVINYVIGNYVELFAVLGAVTTAATFITALTPSKRDDEIVGKVRKVLDFISLKLLNK